MSAQEGPRSRPRGAQEAPRVAQERPKASQVTPKSYPRGAQTVAKPSPASPKTSFEHDRCEQLCSTSSNLEFCSCWASRVLRVMCIKHNKNYGFVAFRTFQQFMRRVTKRQRKKTHSGVLNRGLGASKPFKIDPRAAQEPRKTPTSEEKRSKKRRMCQRSAQERKIVPTWPQYDPRTLEDLSSVGSAGPPLSMLMQVFLCQWCQVYWSATPGHRKRCGGFLRPGPA